MPETTPARADARGSRESRNAAAAQPRLGALDALRGAAIALVVGTHALSYAELPKGELSAALRFAIQSPCVVAFFFADGFLLGVRRRWSPARSAVRLLLPWLAFTLLYGGLRAVYEGALPAESWLVRGHGPREWLSSAWRSEWSAQLYFLPALFLVRSATPLLAACVRAGALVCWGGFALSALASRGVLMPLWQSWFPGPGQEPVLHALWGFPFAMLGAATSLIAARLPRGPALPLGAAVGALLARAAWPSAPQLAQHLYLAALFLAFWCLEPGSHWGALGRRTMGVFLLHLPLAMLPCALLARRASEQPLLRLGLIWSGSFALALLGTLALERLRWGRWLLGELPGRRPAG